MTMKKVMYLLMLGVFCLVSTSSIAQPDTGQDGGDPPPDEELPVMTESEEGKNFKNCGVAFKYDVFAANLTTDVDGTYVLPASAPPMYLEVIMLNELGDTVFMYSYLVEGWEAYPFIFDESGNGEDPPIDETVFRAQVLIEADLTDHCNNRNIIEDLYMEVRLVMYTHRGKFAYPVCDYSEPGDIYSCNVFQGIDCTSKLGNNTGGTFIPADNKTCDSKDLTFYNEVFIPQCICSGNSGFNGGGIRSANGNAGDVLADHQKFELSVLANPFQDQLQLNWRTHSGEKNSGLNLQYHGSADRKYSAKGRAWQPQP